MNLGESLMRSCAVDYSIVQKPGSVLSIVIPTYNRRREIQFTLEAFLAQRQAGGFEDEVDIVVCDNASEDDSEPYLKSLAERGYISYYRHTENIGPMPQLYVGPARARAPYCWFFGDDDWPKHNALSEILKILRKDKYDFISLNYEMRCAKMRNVISPALNIRRSREFRDFGHYCEYFTVYQAGFISCQIFRTERFNAVDPQPYLDPPAGFQHFGAHLQAFYDRPTYYEGRPLVIYRSGNFDDAQKIAFRNATQLSFDLMRAIEIARERANIPADIWERFAGVVYVRQFRKKGTARLSDMILENVFRSIGASYRPTDEDWADLEAISQHWRPKAKLGFKAVVDLHTQVEGLHARKEEDIAQTIAKLQDLRGPEAPMLLQNGKDALISRVVSYDTNRHQLQKFALQAANQISKSGLDGMIRDTAELGDDAPEELKQAS